MWHLVRYLLLAALLSLSSCSYVGKGVSVSNVATTTSTTTTTTCTTELPYSASDAILMAQVINKESSASYEGKLAVASVIINRADYDNLSISEVVFAPNQFSVVNNLDTFTNLDYQAAIEVLTNGSVNNAYYFDGCHEDGLNHFSDINGEYVGAW